MLHSITFKKLLAALMVAVFLATSFAPDALAQRRKRPSKTKNVAVGTAIGAVGGALIGGRKGALIGAGAGAGTGYVVYKNKKRKYRRGY
jgi:osmotically inducible lipoprotein OsmB